MRQATANVSWVPNILINAIFVSFARNMFNNGFSFNIFSDFYALPIPFFFLYISQPFCWHRTESGGRSVGHKLKGNEVPVVLLIKRHRSWCHFSYLKKNIFQGDFYGKRSHSKTFTLSLESSKQVRITFWSDYDWHSIIISSHLWATLNHNGWTFFFRGGVFFIVSYKPNLIMRWKYRKIIYKL